MKNWQMWCLCAALAASGFLAAGSAAADAPPDARVSKIFADWKKRQDRFKSVRYRVKGEATRPKGTLPDPLAPHLLRPNAPPNDVTWPFKMTFLLDFTTNRYRLEEDKQQYDDKTRKLYPSYEIQVFDGKVIKAYRPRERNTHPTEGVGPSQPELGIGEGYFGNAGFTMGKWPVFIGHGSIQSYEVRVVPGKLKVLPKRELIRVHGQGVHRGRACLVLRSPARDRSFEEWWVDAARDSVVVRYVSYLGGKPYIDMEMDYEQTADGALLSGWTYTQRDPSLGKIRHVQRMRVEARTLNPEVSDTEFTVPQKPGMLVARVFRQAPRPGERPPESKTKLYRAGERDQLQEVTFEEGVERPVNRPRWWWLGLLLITAVGISFWFIRYRTMPRPGSD